MKQIRLFWMLFIVVLSACTPFSNSELTHNREKWLLTDIHHYRFQVIVSCFCSFVHQMPLEVEVQDGQVVSMTYKDGTAVPAQERSAFAKVETIDALFDYSSRVMQQADRVDIQYDPIYSYPASVSIDFMKNAMDDEMDLRVQSFELLP